MLRLAFDEMMNATVSDLEQQLPKPSYTLQTIEHLQSKHPDTLYYLCIGQDSLRNFHEWHRYEEILVKVDLLVAERPGFDNSQIAPAILEHAIFVEHKPYSVSSSAIRRLNGKVKEDLPNAVADYIEKNNLY